MTTLADTNRRTIRYVCFRIQGGTHEQADNPFPELVEPVRELVESQPGFTNWAGFSREWDLGIDDVRTMASRGQSQTWLWGIPRTTVVRRKPGRGSPEELLAAGFGKQTPAGVRFTADDYARICEGASNRTEW